MASNSELTTKQQEFLRKLTKYIRQEKRPPTTRELQDSMGFGSPRSVSQYLEVLENTGYIERGQGARNIRLLKAAQLEEITEAATVEVPVVGRVPCGIPLLAEENIDWTVRVSTRFARPPYKYYILEADGDSMEKAGIPDGSYVLIRQQSEAVNGERVVALIDGEATIKEFHRTVNAIILRPKSSNKKHQAIILTHDLQILGVVQTVLEI